MFEHHCIYKEADISRVNILRRRRQWQATLVLLPRKSHGWRSLVGCSPCGRYKSDATERLHFHFSLSHNGEGNGNPLEHLFGIYKKGNKRASQVAQW